MTDDPSIDRVCAVRTGLDSDLAVARIARDPDRRTVRVDGQIGHDLQSAVRYASHRHSAERSRVRIFSTPLSFQWACLALSAVLLGM